MKHIKPILFAVLSLIACAAILPENLLAQWLKDPAEEPREDHAEDYLRWFYGRRTTGLGYIPQDAWLKAMNRKEALKNEYLQKRKGSGAESIMAAQADASWINVGPINIEQGIGAHSGRVNTIVTDPTDPNIAYLGAANGGVWKTVNGGDSWHPTMDNAISLAMGALAIDPSNPKVLYAGTGEYSKGIGAFFGAGILKTTDAGATWKSSGLATVGAFSTIVINPNRTSTIYAAGAGSGGGFYISDDAGATWRKAAGGLPPGDVTDIAYGRLNSSDMIYVAMPSHGVWISQDGGASWNDVTPGAFAQMRRVHLGIDPKNWKDVVALSVSFDGSFEGLQQTNDGGQNWSDISVGLGGGGDIFSSGGNYQGWYDAYVHRDPIDPLTILVGGISIWKTEDDGSSWNDVAKAYQFGGIHPDQHAATFSAGESDIVYVGSDGGVAVSTDRGSSYDVKQDSLAITESYGIAIDQTVDDISYTGNQDNGTLTGGRNADWSSIGGGDGGTVVVDSKNHGIVYFIRPTAWAVSRFANGNETDFSNGINSTDSVQWTKPLVQDETNHILYTGSQFLYVMTNGSSSWTRRSKKLASQSYISAIAPAGDGKTLLVGTTGGMIWSSIDNGVTFIDRSATLPGREIAEIKASPTDTKTFYVALSGFGISHVLKTSDLGATWHDISSTLPDISCNAIVVDDQHPTNLYVGTDVGVFFSPDDGLNWMPYGSGLPNVAVTDLAFHKTNRVLRAGTHGRSMWEAPMSVTASAITTPTISNVWYNGEPAQVGWYGISAPNNIKIEISTDNAATWSVITQSASGNGYTIGKVNYVATENALIRVSAGSDILQSQSFRIRTRPAGSTMTTLSEQPLYMYDLAYDKDDDVLWVTNFTTAATNPDTKIYKIDPNSGARTGSISVSGGGYFTGIKYDPSTKHLFVHETRQDNSQTFIYEITTTGSIVHKWASPCQYATGIYVSGDSLFLADRNNNVIHIVKKSDPSVAYGDFALDRRAAFGPRCITYNPTSNEILHTWTDFQGTEANATLYDSYILRLSRDDGAEVGSWFVQEGTNSGTNVRGIEYDPRSSGTNVWVTVLNSGNSSKILRLTLVDGPTGTSSGVSHPHAGSFAAIYPNPFTDATTMVYSLDHDCMVKLLVHDVLGREIYSTPAQMQSGGDHQMRLPLGSVPGGRYFCELYIDGVRTDVRALVKE
ncbi:MAG: hypothetical protein Q8919_04200 [Bacteroidota bacterium]|nr:hypothetical protein [Bacteroidota bacterium]